MAEASRPPKAPASEVDEKKKEKRFWASWRRYQHESRKKQPGNMTDSNTPRKKRVVSRPA